MFNQTTFRFKYWLTAALLSLSASVLAQENVDINLQGDGLPVATAHFTNESAAPVNITDVIRSDLSRSGGLVNFPVGGATVGLNGANPAEWGARGAHALVVGDVVAAGSNYAVRLR